MKKKLIVFLIGLLLAVCAVNAEDTMLTLKDINTNQILTDSVAYIELNENIITEIINENGTIELGLGNKSYELIFMIDKVDTEGKDYYKKQSVKDSTEILLYPTGSIRGIVKDKLDNVVANANLKFECSSAGFRFPERTDQFGSFYAEYAPIGECRIYANYGKGVGFEEIKVEHGKMHDIELMLDQTIMQYDIKTSWLWPLLDVIFIALIAGYLILRKKKKVSKVPEAEKKKSRAEDIKETLSKKEKDVVDYLMEQDKKSALQSNIRHSTSIARTSLARILEGLERKKIIHIKKEGKIVKISLTKWFMGKE